MVKALLFMGCLFILVSLWACLEVASYTDEENEKQIEEFRKGMKENGKEKSNK